MRKKIFDLFVQADKALERSDGGMGVGLTLTRRLVELHGGTITANSAGRGKGSEFVVTLPLTNKQPAATVATQSLPEAGGRVLIVEDNPDSREMLETLLRLDGYEVSTARDGIEGWEAIRANPPNVALIDIGLPRLDGYQLARRVRAESSHHLVRLVALTGYGRADDRRAVREAGFDEHLVKPVQPSELNRVLRNTK